MPRGAQVRGGLAGLLAAVGKKPEPRQGWEDRPERVTPPGHVLAGGVVDALRGMPGAMEAIRWGVAAESLLEHPEQHRVALIAAVVREVCREYGVPVARGCDWSAVVRLLYPAGAAGDWVGEANRAANEAGLHPRYRWVEENPLLSVDEDYLAGVLCLALAGDGSALVGLVERVADEYVRHLDTVREQAVPMLHAVA